MDLLAFYQTHSSLCFDLPVVYQIYQTSQWSVRSASSPYFDLPVVYQTLSSLCIDLPVVYLTLSSHCIDLPVVYQTLSISSPLIDLVEV